MKIAYGRSRTETHWKNADITWQELVQKLASTKRTSETVAEYLTLTKDEQAKIKDVGGFVLGHLKGGRRKKGFVECRSAITLDMDYGVPKIWENTISKLPYRCVVYSTHRHTPENPRLRVILPLARDVSEAEYPAVARWIANEIGIELFDDTSYEPERLMFWASTPKDGEYIYSCNDTPDTLNPDTVLATYPDWHDTSTWKKSSREQSIKQRSDTHMEDPRLKVGTIGAFCRCYPITKAIETFLPDVYRPSTVENRYDYIKGEGTAGLVVYDDLYAYSHHATDPINGKEVNAFDLVRIHKFGQLDKDCDDEMEHTKLPSYKAMLDFAEKDKNVQKLLMDEACNDFSDEDRQQIEQIITTMPAKDLNSGKPKKNNLLNACHILQNDPRLQNLCYNEFTYCLWLKGAMPWDTTGDRRWVDADDAQLFYYIEKVYGSLIGSFLDKIIRNAITKVANDRKYHPIKEFLDNLPKWDGIKRVDTLLTEYLGAADTEYTRAAIRKTLCAAIMRVRKPGCKWDYVLVLNGPQGIGKSTLFGKLALEKWYSDSLTLSDIRNKTAAEKLLGQWINELSELAGFKKAEIEMVRSFVSRRDDIYRPAYGRNAESHPRQSILVGTTNAEQGYLQDTQGNRRYLPIKVPGGTEKHSWAIPLEEIMQIWAEAKAYVDAGERLTLSPSEEQKAQEAQLDALESDERFGMIDRYLEMPLPLDWDSKSIYERRRYINAVDAVTPNGAILKRDRVCVQEVWCECFGYAQAQLTKRSDRNAIVMALKKLGWQSTGTRYAFKLYGRCESFVKDERKN